MRQFMTGAVRAFIQGLFVLLPLLVTAYLAVFLIGVLDSAVAHALHLLPPDLRGVPLIVIGTKLMSAAVLFAAVVALGLVARTVIGRTAVAWLDRVFDSIPVLASVYSSTRQVVDVLSGGQERFFDRPVLVQYPSVGIWVVAFETGRVGRRLSPDPENEYVTVFIPTTPNPTSGVLAMVSRDWIRTLDLSVEDAMKLILTGGVVKPEPRSAGVPSVPAAEV